MKRSFLLLITLALIVTMLLPMLAACGGETETTVSTTAPSYETTAPENDESSENTTQKAESDAKTETTDEKVSVKESEESITDTKVETLEASETSSALESTSESLTASESETQGQNNLETENNDDIPFVDALPLEGEYASTIDFANKNANGVNVSYTSEARDHILIENKNMKLTYLTHSFADKQVASIKSSSGNS